MGLYYRLSKSVTEKEKYPEALTKPVNIFSRAGRGCGISFAGFTDQDE